MPTLILEDVPVSIYETLQRRAVADQRSVTDQAMHLLRQVLETASDVYPVDSSSSDADEADGERPWRGVFVPPRPRRTLFVQAVGVADDAMSW